MDPSSIPPPPPPAAVPFTVEPNNNHPPAPITSPPGFTHPSYADMIYRAIEALKEKNGSSKRAIAKYIEEVYKDQLPPTPTHSTLLTQHLKRLKDNGLLQMVNKSYILPRSVPPPPSSPSAAPQASRPRGRPRKLQAQSQAQQAQILPLEPAAAAVNANVVHPVWAALGLSDEPQPQALTLQAEVLETERKRLGRPRKSPVASAGPVVPSATVSPGRRGRPPGSKNKKRPGFTAKAESSAAAAAGAASSGTKRRPGRPRKNQQATPIPLAPAAEGEVPVALAGGDVPVVVATSLRGRPKRNAGVPAAAAAPVGAGSGRGRGRGRGRGGARGRGGGRLSAQPRSSFGRPVGRPKKGTTSASTSQNVADGDLKRKLEHFQSKVKESLEVLKPHFTHESPVSAIAAIQDLEVLGAMDLNAPLEDETLPQQPQQPPQQQQLQQQQQQPPPPQQPLQLPPQHYIQPPQPQALAPQQIYQHQFPQFQQPYQPQQPQQYQNQHQQPSQQFQPQLPHHRLFNP